jgi:hypothetical protein
MFPGDEVIEPKTRERVCSEWLIQALEALLGMNN